MSTIAQVLDAVAQLNASVKGVKFAANSGNMPAELKPDQLPAAVTWYAGDDWLRIPESHFEIEVYVAKVGSVTPTQAMQQCLTIAENFRETFRATHKVLTFPIIRERGGSRRGFGTDGVHKTIGYGGQEYYGFCIGLPLMGVL